MLCRAVARQRCDRLSRAEAGQPSRSDHCRRTPAQGKIRGRRARRGEARALSLYGAPLGIERPRGGQGQQAGGPGSFSAFSNCPRPGPSDGCRWPWRARGAAILASTSFAAMARGGELGIRWAFRASGCGTRMAMGWDVQSKYAVGGLELGGGRGVACHNVPVARRIDSLVWATACDRSSPDGGGAVPPFPQSPSCTGASCTWCRHPRRV